jgi:hypothetical protein
MPRTVLISQERIGNRMTRPGIRYTGLARTLAAHVDTV